MRLFISGLAAVSLMSLSIAGCKKEDPAAPAATTATAEAKPAGDKPADPAAAPAGNAEKPADPAAAAPAAVDPAAAAPAAAPAVAIDTVAIEAGIKQIEDMVAILKANAEDCDKAAAELTPFFEKNKESMVGFNKMMQGLSPEQQKEVQAKYMQRMMGAMQPMMEIGMKCEANENFKKAMSALAPEAAAPAAPAAPANP